VVVANRDSDNISTIRTTDDTVVATIKSVTPKPVFITIDPS
jgi:DNA-binding beta-propeller fold protein YncE